MKRFMGLDIGGTKCAVVIGDAEGHIEREIRFATEGYEETLARLLSACEELFTDDVAAIGDSIGNMAALGVAVDGYLSVGGEL